MHDLVIRNGLLIDGTGAPARTCDIAIDGDLISAVGVVGAGAREIDAEGRLVTPGWVDIHTHYDGQATWDPILAPSVCHGVTTVVMGNCGVGFAPVRPDRGDWLISLMEGVEDIPGTALAEGIKWTWESFPQYLDALRRLPRTLDVACQVPHGALRAYVMGERAAANETATAEDLEQMRSLLQEALAAGALGFSTSRTGVHRATDGRPVPGTYADDRELETLARVVAQARGIFEAAPAGTGGEGFDRLQEDVQRLCRISRSTGCITTFLLSQSHRTPEGWRAILSECAAAAASGARVHPQVYARPTTVLFSFESTNHPFMRLPAYREIAALPHAEKIRALASPSRKEQILREQDSDDELGALLRKSWERTYVLGDPADYEPNPHRSVSAQAAQRGLSPAAHGYDCLLERTGRQILMYTLNGYAYDNLDSLREMMLSPGVVVGGSDAGAHCRIICDAALPTFMLTHWSRDRLRGERLPLEWVVQQLSSTPAAVFGLTDRGVLAAGYKADLNVIDYSELTLHAPFIADDLPTGAQRYLQEARGYDFTMVSGQIIRERDEDTCARPGRVARAARGVA